MKKFLRSVLVVAIMLGIVTTTVFAIEPDGAQLPQLVLVYLPMMEVIQVTLLHSMIQPKLSAR